MNMGLIYEFIRSTEHENKKSMQNNALISFMDFFEILLIYSNDTRSTIVDFLLGNGFFELDYYTYDIANNECKHTYSSYIKNCNEGHDSYEHPFIDYLTRIINEEDTYKYCEYYLKKEDILGTEAIITIGIGNLDSEVEQPYNQPNNAQAYIEKLEDENNKLKEKLENQGYLDPNNKFFSIEMKLCHDTWNYLYKDGNNSHLAHGKQVANYLENHADLTVSTKAINRIKTITNPKRTLASGDADDDI